MLNCIPLGQSLLGWMILMKLEILPLVANSHAAYFKFLKAGLSVVWWIKCWQAEHVDSNVGFSI